MALTVKQLIAKLKKHDPNALVVFHNFDQDEDECDGYIGSVDDAPESLLGREGKKSLVVLGGG